MCKYFVYILLLPLFISGCEKPAKSVLTDGLSTRISETGVVQLINSEGEPVLLVSGQKITPDDVLNEPASIGKIFLIPLDYLEPIAQGLDFEEFKEKIEEKIQVIVADKITYILLYKIAKKKYPDGLDDFLDKAAESEIRKFVLQFGGDQAAADKAIEVNWHDRESYKKILKQDILTQWYISSLKSSNNIVTYRQLKKKYESMKKDSFEITPSIEFRLIDIVPSRLEIQDPNENRNDYAEKLAQDIYARLQSGEDFAELAKQYSQGPKKPFGGLWQAMNPNSLAEPYDSIAKAVQKMNPGDISEPIISGAHFFIVKLENKKSAGFVPFEEVQNQVREALISEQNTNTALNKLDETVMQQMSQDETDEFIDYCLEKIYKKSNQG